MVTSDVDVDKVERVRAWSMKESVHEGDKEETKAGRHSERDSSGDDSSMSRRCWCCARKPLDQQQPATMSSAAASEMAMAETEGTGFGTVT